MENFGTSYSSDYFEIFENYYTHGFDKKLQKWSLARNQNVNYLYRLWEEKPDRIEVLEDRDSVDEQLIIMKRKKFEDLIQSHRELLSKAGNEQKDYELLLHTIQHVTSFANSNQVTSDPRLRSAIRLLEMVSSRFACH